MRLDAITLKNFRCFEDITINFDQKLTVMVAVNGAGKTTVLDAVRIALWPYLNSFDLAHNGVNDSANSITIDDVTKAVVSEDGEARLLPSKITVHGEALGVTAWCRVREKESPNSKTLDDMGAKELRKLALQVQSQLRTPDSLTDDLPVFGYYGTGRLWSNKKEKKKTVTRTEIDNTLIRTYGYMDCLDPASSYRAFEKWFIKTLSGHAAEIGKIVKRDGRLNLYYETKFSNRIEVIQKALNTVLASTDYQTVDLNFDAERLEMYNHRTDITLRVDQLSDGIRNMVGMVADIAYRCYQLNPHLGARAALDAKGIVMIDEVDMHLHPSWQQLVIGQLQEAFPKIQFIVTTHSPQVLSTVPSECIRILDNGQVYAAPQGTKGAESSRLLERVFGTDSRPKNDENTVLLNTYLDLVYKDQFEAAAAKRPKLDEIFGNEEPALTAADLYIENRQWELGLEEN